MAKEPELEDLQDEIRAFKDAFKVAFLASSDANGVPEASHVPFVMNEQGQVYLLISELAKHTQNLRINPVVSLLLLEPENEAINLFALRRLQLECGSEFIESAGERQLGLELLSARFGRFIDTLSALGDFRVVRLTPKGGKFVRGFAQTYYLSGPELLDVTMYKAK